MTRDQASRPLQLTLFVLALALVLPLALLPVLILVLIQFFTIIFFNNLKPAKAPSGTPTLRSENQGSHGTVISTEAGTLCSYRWESTTTSNQPRWPTAGRPYRNDNSGSTVVGCSCRCTLQLLVKILYAMSAADKLLQHMAAAYVSIRCLPSVLLRSRQPHPSNHPPTHPPTHKRSRHQTYLSACCLALCCCRRRC